MKFAASMVLFSCVACFTGCRQETTPPPVRDADSVETHDHDNGHGHVDHGVAGHAHGSGPHHGVIADWGGGKYHVEFTVDHDEAQATVFVLGADEKTPSPIAAETIELAVVDPAVVVTLKAAPHENDPAGTASRFVGRHEKLGVVQEYEGTLTGVIDGTPYSGDFKE